MPFVLPSGVAEGSQQAIYLRLKYQEEQAASSVMTGDVPLVPMGYQQITNANLATAQKLTVPAGATIAYVENNGSQPCRWRDDNVAPTAEMGRVLEAGSERRFNGNLSVLQLIRGGDGVTLDISYYKIAGA